MTLQFGDGRERMVKLWMLGPQLVRKKGVRKQRRKKELGFSVDHQDGRKVRQIFRTRS